jgi:hypothetical protein
VLGGHGGILNKARRGALKLPLPIGLCYTENEVIVLDPDLLVQTSIREVIRLFQHTGSAFTTVRPFHQEQLLFPRRIRYGPHQGEIAWGEIQHHDVLRVLHQPAYAGAYVGWREHVRPKQPMERSILPISLAPNGLLL